MSRGFTALIITTVFVSLLTSAPINSLQVNPSRYRYLPPRTPHAVTNVVTIASNKSLNRREAMRNVAKSIVATWTTTILPQKANAIYNPLNLKGSFWETGELYQKKDNALPSDPDELLPSLISAVNALESCNDIAIEGRFEDLSRQLRGGTISESQIRLRGYALLDLLPDKDDSKAAYLAGERFRVFLIQFANLDRMVEAAARQAKIDGGAVETLGLAVIAPLSAANEVARISAEPNMGKDPRISVIAALGGTTKALKAFTKAAEEALKEGDAKME